MKKNTYAVIGLGQFGLAVVAELALLGSDIIAIDRDEESVKKAANFIPTAFIADATNEAALKELGIDNVTHAIVAYGDNLQASLLTTIILVTMGISHIIVRVDDDYYVPIFKKLGASEIIMPQKVAGKGLANRLDDDDFLDYYSLGDNFSIVKITVGNNFIAKSILTIDPRNKFDVNVILLIKGNQTSIAKAHDILNPGDTVYVVGNKKQLKKFGLFLKGE